MLKNFAGKNAFFKISAEERSVYVKSLQNFVQRSAKSTVEGFDYLEDS